MKLLIESGSTKANWLFMDEGQHSVHHTIGLNPYIVSSKDITSAFDSLQVQQPERIKSVFFYGAGCANPDKCSEVSQALQIRLPQAHIAVESDLLAAAHALFANTSGLVGILGTGSNVALFNGASFTRKNTSLGYILGDYGSGNHIGRLLLQAFFNNRLEEDLANDFTQQFDVDIKEVLDRVYAQKYPNRYLAGFAEFVHQYKHFDSLQNILKEAFQSYFQWNVLPLYANDKPKLGLVGSIAYHFQQEIKEAAKAFDIEIQMIMQDPLKALADYHK